MNSSLRPLVFSLALIVGGILLGSLIQALTKNRSERVQYLTYRIVFFFRNIAFYFMSPFVVINAFWLLDFDNISYVSVPFIGLGALMLGSGTAVLLAKLLKLERKQEGAMFCAGSCSNLGNFGSFICYVFFGEIGIVFAALYRIFETPYYYLFMFPSAREYSADSSKQKESRFLRLIKDPIVLIFFFSISAGVVLNLNSINRPSIFSTLTNLFIPISTVLLLIPLGYTLRLSKVRQYKREVTGISAIKYILTPLFVIGVSLLLDLNHVGDGTLFKTLIILSALPSGFNSLIPTQMFGLDLNLANACWIVTTGLLIPVLALIWFFFL